MKKNTLLIAILILAISTIFYYNFSENKEVVGLENEHLEEEYEEEPEDDFPTIAPFIPSELKGKELEEYKEWRQKLKESGNKFTDFKNLGTSKKANIVNFTATNSYANNSITGTWSQKNILTSDQNGYRADGSAYDPVNDELYVVSTPGHLYKIDESADVKWSLRNHKQNFRGDDLAGINLPDNSFRLLHQNPNGGMEYSDDEGRSWSTANGALFQNSWNFTTVVTKTPTGRRIVAHGGNYDGNKSFDNLYISTDYGLNYTKSSLSFDRNVFEVVINKPHNSRSVYCFAKRKSDSKILVYKMEENDSDFKPFVAPTQVFSGSIKVFGTLLGGKYYFYISGGNSDIFYSDDEARTWTQTSSTNDRPLMDIHPKQPYVCYKGFLELNMSTDYGATWSKNNHYLKTHYVWDLQHMKTYDREDGGNLTFVGLDFGSYYSTNPRLWNSWVSINEGSPNILAYDATTSDRFSRIYTANQDRGTHGFNDDDGGDGVYEALNEANTDVLRVALAKNESSIWHWYYYGTIGRNSVQNSGGANNVTSKDFYGNWWATSMVASPNSNEDAIYIPSGGNRLEKFTYNGSTIVRTYNPFVFPGSVVSFGYSKKNTNRWYAGLKNGTFFYSTNGGATFTKSSYTGNWPGQDDSYKKTRQVIVTSSKDEATVYYAGKGSVFLISNDGGITFTNHNTGLSVVRIMDFDIHPDGKFIFAACGYDGAWVYSVEQDKWFRMTGDAVPEVVEFSDVEYITSKNIVRFATYGSGVLDFSIDLNSLSTRDVFDEVKTIKASPNPTSGIFEVTIPQSIKNVKVKIYASDGKLVSDNNYDVNNGKIKVNLEKEVAGIYFVKVFLEKPVSIKIIKK
ncbi:T9SS type A sorting domain-containing protein [Polaribacter aestuariivivens]|uniref:T9SS type A sorting domain-containing protein n=1 Tax=Polaribacter aestuariivivens TaxID=2304626 RepID=UPI003F496A40